RDDDGIHLLAADDYKVRALADILREKLARRQVPLKALEWSEVEPGAAGTAKQHVGLQQGIPVEKAREIVKLVKETKLKIQVAIQGDQVRVSGKKKDELETVMKILRDRDFGIAMQFTNYRDCPAARPSRHARLSEEPGRQRGDARRARARRARDRSRSRGGGRARREHLQLHPARQGRIDRGDPRPGGYQGGPPGP